MKFCSNFLIAFANYGRLKIQGNFAFPALFEWTNYRYPLFYLYTAHLSPILVLSPVKERFIKLITLYINVWTFIICRGYSSRFKLQTNIERARTGYFVSIKLIYRNFVYIMLVRNKVRFNSYIWFARQVV